jgi:hypothetical protein
MRRPMAVVALALMMALGGQTLTEAQTQSAPQSQPAAQTSSSQPTSPAKVKKTKKGRPLTRKAKYAELVKKIPLGIRTAFRRVSLCESHWNPRAIGGPGGIFRGKYQFTFSSWRAVGGYGDPKDAPAEEQEWRANRLRKLQGWGAWPRCARVAGLI